MGLLGQNGIWSRQPRPASRGIDNHGYLFGDMKMNQTPEFSKERLPLLRPCQTDNYRLGDYPFTSIVVNNTPEAFKAALESARTFALKNLPPNKRIITLNSWNECTECSYLEPDTVNGLAYLDAVRKVFGRA